MPKHFVSFLVQLYAQIGKTKMFKVKFFSNANGNEPVKDWLKNDMNEADRKIIGGDLKTVQYGYPQVGMPLVKHLVEDIYEVRCDISDKRIARVLFCQFENCLVLLHGFIKKTQTTPLQELRLAKTRRNQLKNQK